MNDPGLTPQPQDDSVQPQGQFADDLSQQNQPLGSASDVSQDDQQVVQPADDQAGSQTQTTLSPLDDFVDSGLALNEMLSEDQGGKSDQNTDDDVNNSSDFQFDDDEEDKSGSSPIDTSDVKKNPLDVLEEILGKGEDGEPKEPEKSEEEILAEKKLQAEQQQAEIEAHRKHLIAETQSVDQKVRDDIRIQQSQSLKVAVDNTIPQIERKKIQVLEES